MTETEAQQGRPLDLWSAILSPEDEAVLPPPRLSFRVIALSLLGIGVYGAVSGSFSGFDQIWESALKAPLIVAASLVLCLPSFLVFSTLAGATHERRRTAAALADILGVSTMMLLALMPVTWLFSMGTQSLAFVTTLHVIAWWIGIYFVYRGLRRRFPEVRSGTWKLWTLTFILVSLQMTTVMRPVLQRPPETPFFEQGRVFFLEHYGRLDEKAAEMRVD